MPFEKKEDLVRLSLNSGESRIMSRNEATKFLHETAIVRMPTEGVEKVYECIGVIREI